MGNNGKVHKAKWAIMIYMAADDASAIPQSFKFLKELDELKDTIASQQPNEYGSPDVRIFLQTYTNWPDKIGKPGGFASRRFEINENFSLDNPLDVPGFDENLSMGCSDALSDFIKWCKKESDPDHKLLFLWGHGNGSSMFSLQESYTRISDLYGADLTITDLGRDDAITNVDDLSPEKLFKDRNRVRIRITLRGTTSVDITVSKRTSDFYKGLTHPDTGKEITDPITLIDILPNGNDLVSPEIERLKKYLTTRSNLDSLLEQEICKSLKQKGNEIDILLIMGCCMQMVEFGYELRNSRDSNESMYYVASEELIFFDGYNYKDTFKALVENPEMGCEALAKRLVLDAPVKNTYNEYERQSLTISCVDLIKSQRLADHLKEFADSILGLKDGDPIKEDVWKKIKTAREQCRHFGESDFTYSFIDVTWFFIRFNELVKGKRKYPKDLRNIVDTIITFLQDEYIVQSYIGAGKIPSLKYRRSYGGHGVAIYFPESKEAHTNNIDSGTGIFFQKKIINEKKRKINNRKANDFTLENSWHDFILKYREDYGEPKLDSFEPAPVDMEKKMLLEDKNALIQGFTNTLLEIDRIKTDVIPELLSKIYKVGNN